MTDTRADAAVDLDGAAPTLLDQAGFEQLYADAARPLWSYLYRVVRDATEAEDLVQEAFLRVLRAPVGDLEAGARRAYLFRIASHLAIDRFRARRRRETAVAQLGVTAPRAVPAATADIDVGRSMDRLKPQERALLWMAYVEGSAHADIAESLRVKPASVRVLLFRARRRLRALLARALPVGPDAGGSR